jgi:pimeloyl-ACP methyl ester carboxylesterase
MKKNPVVLLPGLLEDADGFAHQLAGLANVADVVVADLTRSDSMQGLARDALAQAPAGPFAVIAHSMGGYVAFEILRQAPERVSALALLNTNARADSAESTQNRRRLMALAEKDLEAVVATLMPKQVTPGHLSDPAITATISQMARSIGPAAFARQQTAIIGRVDSRPLLPRIACPTLVLAGRADAIMPLELLEEMARAIPGATLVVVEDCGHMAPLEQPEAVTDALYLWLTGEPRPGPDVVAGTRRPPPT